MLEAGGTTGARRCDGGMNLQGQPPDAALRAKPGKNLASCHDVTKNNLPWGKRVEREILTCPRSRIVWLCPTMAALSVNLETVSRRDQSNTPPLRLRPQF